LIPYFIFSMSQSKTASKETHQISLTGGRARNPDANTTTSLQTHRETPPCNLELIKLRRHSWSFGASVDISKRVAYNSFTYTYYTIVNRRSVYAKRLFTFLRIKLSVRLPILPTTTGQPPSLESQWQYISHRQLLLDTASPS
jgi:hypothetical protein